MTPPNAAVRYDAGASEVVGYTYLRKSYSGPESTDRHLGIARGARASEAPVSPSTSTASPNPVQDRIDYLDALCGASSPWHDLDSEGIPATSSVPR